MEEDEDYEFKRLMAELDAEARDVPDSTVRLEQDDEPNQRGSFFGRYTQEESGQAKGEGILGGPVGLLIGKALIALIILWLVAIFYGFVGLFGLIGVAKRLFKGDMVLGEVWSASWKFLLMVAIGIIAWIIR